MRKSLRQIWTIRNRPQTCVVAMEDLPAQSTTSPKTNTSTANTSQHSIASVCSDSIVCRTCHEGDSCEALISPCKCTGTVGLIHQSCIEKWLSSSNTTTCELCKYEFQVLRKPRPFIEWLRHPASMNDRRNLVGDFVCFLLLFPLASVSAWTCITGAMQYASWDAKWECAGLIFLTVFLIHIFFIWCCISLRYHFQVWQEWKSTHQVVKVVSVTYAQQQPIIVTVGNQDINNNSGNTRRNNVQSEEGARAQPSIRSDIPQAHQNKLETISEENVMVNVVEQTLEQEGNNIPVQTKEEETRV